MRPSLLAPSLVPLNTTCRNMARQTTKKRIVPSNLVSCGQVRLASSSGSQRTGIHRGRGGSTTPQRTEAQDMESYETRIREAARIRDLANASLSRPRRATTSSSSQSTSSWDKAIRETTSSVEVMRDIISQFPTRDAISRVVAERPAADDALAGDDRRSHVSAAAAAISDLDIDPRRVAHFAGGDVYTPSQFALTADPRGIAASKQHGDRFRLVGRSPLEFYKDAHFLSEFVSPMGQIYAREVTGLSRKNHRLVVRAVKRARAAGLLSTVHRAITRLQQ
ncbi:hypothetical protein POJ06DRAFT_71214 [Lipomyces tetrasporus]|uniref:Small ribosomal subunit protein bS18m n=1 Tax=Lipomyces tetrasporus TaxID=54092 RepID=A0AAD7VT75_9ASCO|nr:uncharacterized protein POJ06DRAFT_71214 [Lipomyces tetrasporus]KAJ8101797.1 hypothetical protein POJ06DRAFT_71214 [Lipomyces tetrasporus]